jgi:hypothetical protein
LHNLTKKHTGLDSRKGQLPTTRLILRKAGNLTSRHLKLLRTPSKRRGRPIFVMTKARNCRQIFRELKVSTWNARGNAEKKEEY